LWTVKLVYHGLSSSKLPLPPHLGVEQIAQAVAEEVAAEHG
jgi:hypothetical protein